MMNTFECYKEVNLFYLRKKLESDLADKLFKYEPKYKLNWDECKTKPSKDELKQFYM